MRYTYDLVLNLNYFYSSIDNKYLIIYLCTIITIRDNPEKTVDFMKRESIIEAIAQEAGKLGYGFRTGTGAVMAASSCPQPAAWLAPMILKSSTGRRERCDIYSLRLILTSFHTPQTSPATQCADSLWATMEAHAEAICRAVERHDCVRSTRSLKVSPLTGPVSPRGEWGVEAEFEAVTCYIIE